MIRRLNVPLVRPDAGLSPPLAWAADSIKPAALALRPQLRHQLRALVRAVRQHATRAVDKMLQDGKIIEVEPQTVVRVTAESFNERRIEIVAGPLNGRTGWVPC